MEMLEEHHPKVVHALKSRKFTNLDQRNMLLLDNQLTFDLCCNKMFASKIFKAENALSMTSNGGGLKITEKCKIPGYKYLVWHSKKAITNINASVIGHGIGGKDIPIMARLAKARRWSKQ
jgi:hypothetical protein